MTLTDEQARRRAAADQERKDWAELYHIYERCVGIAEKMWEEKLETAAAQQQALAEAMRDRGVRFIVEEGEPPELLSTDGAINVPLFTPRDRVQFIKEVATTLFIEAGSRNRALTALYKDPNGETELAPKEEAVAREGPVEAASGADETHEDEAVQPEAWGLGVPETAQPPV